MLEISFFSPVWLNSPEVYPPKTTNIIFADNKGAGFYYTIIESSLESKFGRFFCDFYFMNIKNAAFTFDLLTNKLSSSKAFETIECPKWTNSNSGVGFGSIAVFFFSKKNELFHVN